MSFINCHSINYTKANYLTKIAKITKSYTKLLQTILSQPELYLEQNNNFTNPEIFA